MVQLDNLGKASRRLNPKKNVGFTHSTRFWDFNNNQLRAIQSLHFNIQLLMANNEDNVDCFAGAR